MKGWWKYAIGIAIGSVICYHLSILVAPNIIYTLAKNKIESRLGSAIPNQLNVSPLIKSSSRNVVMPNPDFIYLTAFYDLSDGPLQLSGPMPDSTYWSVAMYYPNTVNWFVKNDQEYGVNNIDITLNYTDKPTDNTKSEILYSEEKQGFILIRVLISERTKEKADRLNALLKKVKLEPA